ncbi:MAG: S1 RNA-binding domain-containing protein [Chloroflexota bacterium]
METNVIETTSETGEIKRKTHYTGTVVKTSLAGAVVDIGVGIPGVVHISQLQKDPVNRVEDVVQVGQTVDVWVRRTTAKGDRIDLTMIKPLDLDWRDMKADMVLKGKVVRLEKFGAFVDIGAERPGLVHVSELTYGFIKSPDEVVKEGDEVEVKVLDVDRKKKQIRLSMKALEEPPVPVAKPEKSSRGREKGKEAFVEEAPEPPVPTAMEIALREAMERSQAQQDSSQTKSRKKSSGGRKSQDLEDILARTLHTKRS